MVKADQPPAGSREHARDLLDRILSLSYRISCSSPPLKPFMRFSQDTEVLYRLADRNKRSLFWDFDDTLQKILLTIAKAVSTPDQLAQACIARWKINLELLYQGSRRHLQELIDTKQPYRYITSPFLQFILDRLQPGSRFLYVGCGAGTECLSLAHYGHEVIGIDTFFLLTRVAHDWSRHLALPFQTVCMDVMDLGFVKETFDSFLLEFYGYQPTLQQSLHIQENLARVLRRGARGFLVASRKPYASYWFLMGTPYPRSMVRWLANQAALDYHWDNSDGQEEKLVYGLYYRSHTKDSLSRELGYAFQVRDCVYAKDPRYVIGMVAPKENLDSLPDLAYSRVWPGAGPAYPESGAGSILDVLDNVESIGNFLEAHERTVVDYFKDDPRTGQSPFRDLQVEISEFLRLLESALHGSPDFEGRTE
jgi:SAM-dependent methyltransferase